MSRSRTRTRTRTLQLVTLSATAAVTAGIAAPGVAAKAPKSPYAYTVAAFPCPAETFSRIALDAEYDTLYVLDYQQGHLSLVDSTTGEVRTSVWGIGDGVITVDTASHVAYTHKYGRDPLTAIDRDGSTRTVPGMGTNIFAVAADPRAHEIYGTDIQNDAVNVVAAAGGRVATIPVGDKPWDIAVDDVGRRAYVINVGDDTVSIIDLDAHAVVATVDAGPSPYDVAVDVVTHRAYVGDYSSSDVTVIDGSTNSVVGTIATPNGALDLAVDPVTHTAYAADGSLSIKTIDLTSGTVTASVPTQSQAHEVVVDPIRHTALVFGGDVTLDLITQRLVQKAIVTGLSSTSGGTAGGEQITITGTHFAGATKVLFGTTPATSFTVESDERIVVTVPAHQAGKVPVRVKTVGTSALGRNSRYTYTAPAA